MAGMTYAEAAKLQIGDRVMITYQDKPVEVKVVETIREDGIMVVKFADGSFVGVKYQTMKAGLTK